MKKYTSKKKIIRDSVHGDIAFDERFIAVIDTPEFQRLRRIRQLSTAYLIYPNAEHTRFVHSIGTYHVMKLLINHFEGIFKEAKLEIEDRAIQLALAVALLHDIGHGPFSHAFENALPKEKYQKLHEEWTIDIVTSNESNIYKVLVEKFDNDFPREVADLIKKERKVKREGLDTEVSEKMDLFFVLSSLISSQLDADRMDYLLRDAFFTGVTYGKFDIQRLIKALTITENNDKYYVCVHEKYLSTIEEYLLARYQMHNTVYLHPFKVQMEVLVRKILQRMFELYAQKKINPEELPKAIVSIIEGKKVTVSEYTSLDDSVMMALFIKGKNYGDNILSELCSTVIDRNKYRELKILNSTTKDIEDFEKDLLVILKKYDYSIANLENEYFWIADKPNKPNNVIYRNEKENILILRSNGTLCDLMDLSKIITKELHNQINSVFINLEILKLNSQISNKEAVITDIEELIMIYNNRNHIEIEKKYYFQDKNIFNDALEAVKKWDKYEIDESSKSKKQVDTYFDTPEKMLYESNKTLRIRHKGEKHILTIKIPTKKSVEADSNCEDDSQNARFEYEVNVGNGDIANSSEYILKYIPELEKDNKLNELLQRELIIENDRRKILLSKEDLVFEMVFDCVTYFNQTTEKKYSEYQIEIELKSDFLHRINLKQLTNYLDKNVLGLNATTDSKYKRGWSLTQ